MEKKKDKLLILHDVFRIENLLNKCLFLVMMKMSSCLQYVPHYSDLFVLTLSYQHI